MIRNVISSGVIEASERACGVRLAPRREDGDDGDGSFAPSPPSVDFAPEGVRLPDRALELPPEFGVREDEAFPVFMRFPHVVSHR